jgi:FtsP/CotA-like multicopper oxidase with cupredoxin domain
MVDSSRAAPGGRQTVFSLVLIGLAVPLGLGPGPDGPEPPEIRWNDNDRPAGSLEDGTLNVDLEVVRGTWRPKGEEGPPVTVLAFAERGEDPRIPGPMIRVAEGTEVVATVENTLDTTLQLRGLAGRHDITEAEGTWLAVDLKLPIVEVGPGETRQLRFTADAAGTYMYQGHISDPSPTAAERNEDDLLGGAFIVDPPDGGPAEHEEVMVIQTFRDALPPGAEGTGQLMLAINGRPWPHTERLVYEMGDTVTWRVINASNVRPHPMHLHGFFYEVLSRGDIARDTIYRPVQRRKAVTEGMGPWTTMKVRWSPDRPGGWIFHCHLTAHVFPNPDLAADPAPTSLQRIRRFIRGDDARDPHHHAEHGMGGLVMGIYVRPPEGWTPEEPEGEPVRLHVREDSTPGHFLPRFGYALGKPGEAPPPAEVPFPGPPLVLHEGPPAAVRVVNETDEPTTTHWHGLEVESLYDGVAGATGYPERRSPAVMPGDSFDVALRTDRPGTYIYHTHMADYRQQGAGLYGPLIILPEGETWDPATDRVFMVGLGLGEIDPPPPPPRVYLNGSREPETIEMTVGTTYRLRLINITPGNVGPVFRLVRDGFPVRWRPRAHDGSTLPLHQREPVAARQRVSVGETYDFTFTPQRPGELALEVRNGLGAAVGPGGLLVRQPIRVVAAE